MTFDLDEGLGILLKKIKELGIEDNTYIIYMSDNGSVPNIPGAKKYEKRKRKRNGSLRSMGA